MKDKLEDIEQLKILLELTDKRLLELMKILMKKNILTPREILDVVIPTLDEK